MQKKGVQLLKSKTYIYGKSRIDVRMLLQQYKDPRSVSNVQIFSD